MRPALTQACACITTGSKWSEWSTDSNRPLSRALAIIASHSATESAIGFSTNTWQPMSSACRVSGAWLDGGVSTYTACGWRSASRVKSPVTNSIPKLVASACAALVSMSQMPTISTNSSRRSAAMWWRAT